MLTSKAPDSRPHRAVPDLTGGMVRRRAEQREQGLSPNAARSAQSRGRRSPEAPDLIRTAFQKDRDRIVHCKAFRRLKHKTQVFIAPLGDHYVTRLTHTLEVAQIGRTIARALDLNEDLVEAIALAHDMGHTPFGHTGEDVLNELTPDGFVHSAQSLRIVDRLEKDGRGLNLTWEARHGIEFHSKPRGDFLQQVLPEDLTLEAQVCRVADAVAYLNHDMADAFRAGVLSAPDLPSEAVAVLGDRHSQRINTMVTDVVRSSWDCTEAPARGASAPAIRMGEPVKDAVVALREFMFDHVYLRHSSGPEASAARQVVRTLFDYFDTHRDRIPEEYALRSESAERAVIDYISGMTDRYALRIAEEISPGVAGELRRRLL